MRASLRLSGQLPVQRSGTLVTARPDEQLAPNKPILSLFALYIAMRLGVDSLRASTLLILIVRAHDSIAETRRKNRERRHAAHAWSHCARPPGCALCGRRAA